MADYSPVKGCIVFRPYGYRIWELIQQEMDKLIKEAGVPNAYFPLLIPYSFLEKEAKHIEGFAPEVAIVTYGGGKELEEKLVIRPTSETIIYSMFSKWIHSYRDLPLRLNQWANVVRWEKRTLPFLRTTEFLWQEGHTIHATKEDAEKEVKRALVMYEKFMNENLAIYVIPGKKTEAEKFAGANYTYSVEGLMRDGKALQCGTSHLLDQSFAKSFDIKFVDKDGKEQLPWMTSWGSSTRMIGGVILSHGDDKGLVLPPRIAPIQVVAIPIMKGNSGNQELEAYVEKIKTELKNVRLEIDWSDNSPGWKFSQWEMKGVPLRLEIGGKEVAEGVVSFAKRNTGEKGKIKISEIGKEVAEMLENIQNEMFQSHKKFVEDNTHEAKDYEELKKIIKEKKGFVKVKYSATKEKEDLIKYETKATARCMPLESIEEKGSCFYDGSKDAKVTYFAKAY